MAALVREAAVIALREFMSAPSSGSREVIVCSRHFETALSKVKPSVSQKVGNGHINSNHHFNVKEYKYTCIWMISYQSLSHGDDICITNLVHIWSSNRYLVADGTKPLPEPMLTFPQWDTLKMLTTSITEVCLKIIPLKLLALSPMEQWINTFQCLSARLL